MTEGITARVDYTYRQFHNLFVAQEVNAIMDPTGMRTVGWMNGNPLRTTEYGFNPNAYNRYWGIDLILEAQTGNLELQGSYTLSWSWGPGIDASESTNSAFSNARFEPFFHSYQPGLDTRHQIKTSTTYTLHGFTIGMIFDWRSGVAIQRDYPIAEDGYSPQRAPVGYEPGTYYNTGTSNPGQNGTYSDVRSWTELRTPDLLTCNLMLSYDFSELLKQHVIVNLAVANVLGLTAATDLNQTEGSPNSNQFGLVNSRQSFRSFTAGVRYQFWDLHHGSLLEDDAPGQRRKATALALAGLASIGCTSLSDTTAIPDGGHADFDGGFIPARTPSGHRGRERRGRGRRRRGRGADAAARAGRAFRRRGEPGRLVPSSRTIRRRRGTHAESRRTRRRRSRRAFATVRCRRD